jgi:DNA-binding NarL/FixJ family response regulator
MADSVSAGSRRRRLTNKHIGAHLFISERTVDSHAPGILNKLGVGSRAQIAARVATIDR